MNDNKGGEEKSMYRARAERELNKKLKEFVESFDTAKDEDGSDSAPDPKRSDKSALPENVKRDFTALLSDAPGVYGSSDKDTHEGHRKRMRAAARRDIRLEGFRDAEILEILLSYLIPRQDTAPLSRMLLERYGSVLNIIRAPAQELIKFPLLNKNTVALLPAIAVMSLMYNGKPIIINNHIDAADYFGSLFLGSKMSGTFAVCISSDGRLLGVEKCDDGEVVSLSSVLGATVKYNTRHVILIRRERAILPDSFSAVNRVGKLSRMLKEIGIHMADFLLFTDYGYYTLGAPNVNDEFYPQYIFVPIKSYASAPELIDMVAAGGKLPAIKNNERIEFAGRADAEFIPHILRGLTDFLRKK